MRSPQLGEWCTRCPSLRRLAVPGFGTLEGRIALSSGAVVPGHGDVADVAFATRSLEEIRAIADLGRQVAATELSLEDAVARAPYRPAPARAAIERAVAQARGELDAG
jgi:hypothetical protein